MPNGKLAARFQRILANLEGAIDRLPLVIVFDNTDLARPLRPEAVCPGGQRIG